MSIVKESNYVCASCGVAGYLPPNRFKVIKTHFCNRQCFHKFMDKKQEIKCDYCDCVFIRKQHEIKRTNKHFCCNECRYKFQNKQVEVECLVCQKKFMKSGNKVKINPRHFCSKECAKNIQSFKDWVNKRSKLEISIEEHLKTLYSFEIRYNKTDIGYELDIYIPCLDLAIEINGILHYEAIFGEAKLLRTQQIDKEKVERCRDRDIKLIVINVSRDGAGKKIKAQRISEVEKIVRDRIIELDFKNEQIVI